jgi:hypothetical protein
MISVIAVLKMDTVCFSETLESTGESTQCLYRDHHHRKRNILDLETSSFQCSVSTVRPDRLWGPPSLLFNGYRGILSPGVKPGRGVMLTTHPLLVPRLGMRGAIPPVTQMRLYGA